MQILAALGQKYSGTILVPLPTLSESFVTMALVIFSFSCSQTKPQSDKLSRKHEKPKTVAL